MSINTNSKDHRASFSYQLMQLSRSWRRLDEKIMAEHGYHDVSWVPLIHLHGAAPMMQKELAARCGLDTSSLVRLLTPLTEQGLVKRTPNPDDGRAWLLKLTKKGNQRAEHINGILRQSEEAMLNAIPKELIEAFLQITQLINNNINQINNDPSYDPSDR